MKILTHPELVIGLAGPIGINIEGMADEVGQALKQVGYDIRSIHITSLMAEYAADGVEQVGDDYFSSMNFKMDYANKLCELADDPSALMRVAIKGIKQERTNHLSERGSRAEVGSSVAYVIRQLKRPEEVELLRKVYGKRFVLISGYGSRYHRLERIKEKGKSSLPISATEPEIAEAALSLVLRDEHEGKSRHVQHLRDTFHLADVFVDGINQDQMRSGIRRFIDAFFGRVDIGPTKIEYGMYAAKAAALRSTDLSRQVGSALFTPDGEIIAQGCNEVPRAFGGTYWSNEEPDFRDVKLGYDPNDALKKDVIRDLLERLEKAELLKNDGDDNVSSEKFVERLLGNGEADDKGLGCLKGSQVSELTEYGRVVHAEMVSICDAARLGKSVKGATLFVTTFPCHNCTKHIIAAGVERVFYLEPYPKSKAKTLHSNEIEIERSTSTKVAFLPFLGISPFRYRDIFEKGSRKTAGKARTWYSDDDQPRPLVPEMLPKYVELEDIEVDQISGRFTTVQS